MALRIEATLAPRPDACRRGRRAVGRLRAYLEPVLLEDVRLLVSELVCNSLRHAGLESDQWIELVAEVSLRAIRVEVRDPGAGFDPPPAALRPGPGAGWGFLLVDALADRWGMSRDRGYRV